MVTYFIAKAGENRTATSQYSLGERRRGGVKTSCWEGKSTWIMARPAQQAYLVAINTQNKTYLARFCTRTATISLTWRNCSEMTTAYLCLV